MSVKSGTDKKAMFLKVDLYSDSKSVELHEVDINQYKMKSYNDYIQLKHYQQLWVNKQKLVTIVSEEQTPEITLEDIQRQPPLPTPEKQKRRIPKSAQVIRKQAGSLTEIGSDQNAVSNCMTPKGNKKLNKDDKRFGSLTDRGEASKGKSDFFPGNLQIEYPDGSVELLELNFTGIESWLKSPEDHKKLLDYLVQWEKAHNDYISQFSNEFGAISCDHNLEEEEEEEEAPKKKNKAQPGNFEFGDDDEPSIEGAEVDFDAMMKAKKKAAMANAKDDKSEESENEDTDEDKPPKQMDILKKQLEICIPKKILYPPKKKKSNTEKQVKIENTSRKDIIANTEKNNKIDEKVTN